MITTLKLTNFKGHRDTTIRLDRFTVLAGPNGAGKTSVLQALHLMSRLAYRDPSSVFADEHSLNDLIHRSEKGDTLQIFVRGDSQGGSWEASINWTIAPPSTSSTYTRGTPRLGYRYGSAKGEDMKDRPLQQFAPSAIVDELTSSLLYHFDAAKVASAAYSEEVNPRVAYDGSNTAVVLATLKLEHEEAFNRIEEELRHIVPNVERIRIRRAKVSNQVGHKIYLDFRGIPGVPAHAASEGTLITLALLTALCSPNRPRLLLLDDIDQSLHPQAQIELVRELKRLLEIFPDVQIVATTHSPFILDELEPSEVLVFALRDDGSVAVKPLSEHPEAERMKGSLSTGQIWTLDPEKRWVAGEQG